MNNQRTSPIRVIYTHCSQFVSPLRQALEAVDLWVVQSFDLRSTRALHEGCTCPNHGTERCNCELVVLLVYPPSGDPATLTLDGRDGKTFVYIVDATGSAQTSAVEELIQEVIQNVAIFLAQQRILLDAD